MEMSTFSKLPEISVFMFLQIFLRFSFQNKAPWLCDVGVTMWCRLQELSLRVTVAEATDDGRGENLGHVIIGPEASGMGITHWNQMLATLRKPVSMWHPLRRI